MKINFSGSFAAALLFLIPTVLCAQAPSLGTAANFALFSSNGAVSNTGTTHITGHVGTNNGSSTNFGNIDGIMHDKDAASAQAATDLLIAYNQLNAAIATFFPAPLLGNGQVLEPGVYSISNAATLNLNLTLDAKGNTNAVFIIKIQGAFSTNAAAKVKLINGAKACNVFWKIEGLVSMATGTSMKGTLIANNAAITMSAGDTLEGRAFSTTGAVTVANALISTPIGCGSPVLNGPAAPILGSAACYALFSSDGEVSNTGATRVTGDVGSNVGSTKGYDPLMVTGTIHPLPDGSTQQAAADLLFAYNAINATVHDIELLYPAQFGNNLTLTPHTYLLGAATALTDTVFLNAQGNTNAVFVLKINGALSTSPFAKVVLTNGALAKNVYWLVKGAISISNNSVFKGTVLCNGAVNVLSSSTILEGRVLTIAGALTTSAVTATSIRTNCFTTGLFSSDEKSSKMATVSPNPISTFVTVLLNNEIGATGTLFKVYDVTGTQVMNTTLSGQSTTLQTGSLTSGMYVYKLERNGSTLQSGHLIVQ